MQTNKQTNKQNGHFLQLNLRTATKSVSFNKVKLPNCYELITNKHWTSSQQRRASLEELKMERDSCENG